MTDQRLDPSILERLSTMAARLKTDVDLVDFGDFVALMFTEDNLYSKFLPETIKRKFTSVMPVIERAHHLGSGTPPAVKDILPVVASHLWAQRVDFEVLDIGAHVGRFTLNLASYFRAMGRTTPIHAFDAGPTAVLLMTNVFLNGLQPLVSATEVAVGTENGVARFYTPPGHTDSSSLSPTGPTDIIRLVNMTAISEIVGPLARSGKTAIIKIDTEGLEQALMRAILQESWSIRPVMVFEFTPAHYDGGSSIDFLKALEADYLIHDIGISVQPIRCEPVNPESINRTLDRCAEQYGYTDLLIVPRRLPDVEGLVARMTALA